jgi:CDP-diacylglycerol pyrophosphatase
VQVDLPEDEERGYAILKDRRGDTQFLLIPTGRISGIESPALLAANAPNYFAAAWQARSYVNERARRALLRENISLAVNSTAGRSQDQLHIHIDCIRTEVRDLLRRQQATLTTHWAPFPVPLEGHVYMAMWIPGEELESVNPFRLLADQLPGARTSMGIRTLVVAGMTRLDGQPGFVLLTDHASPDGDDNAHGEDLQDHSCTVAR